ncbi:MAG: NPCBM/NEW2 domain-containing protein [Pseudomonadota bacterium]
MLLFVASLPLACGREDIDLSRSFASGGGAATVPNPGDCQAQVPVGLLAARPPLGWNGYNAFECAAELDEAKVKANAQALIDSGMQAAGYRYVNLDKCWQQQGRDAAGFRRFDPARLPDGIEGLSAWLHKRGLSLGLFVTNADCGVGPASDGYEADDVKSFETWGIDYVKYVACVQATEANVERFANALSGASRPVVLSLTTPPFAEWMPRTAQLWRSSDNVQATWASLTTSIDIATKLAAYARPGSFNDPDMLQIGNGLTASEGRVQFSVWSILSAPLLAGNDLSTMDVATQDILTNTGLISLDQDALGLQAGLVRSENGIDVLAKPLEGCGARGVVLWNRGDAAGAITLRWSDLWLASGAATVQDLWRGAELPADHDGITLQVPSHDAVALRVAGVEPALPRGEAFLSDLAWTYAVNGLGPPELDSSNGEQAAGDGDRLSLRGSTYAKGIGVNGPSLIRYRLGQACSRFQAEIGIDDDTNGRGGAEFEVWADGVKRFESGALTANSAPMQVDVDISGSSEVRLFVGLGGDASGHGHADWANARVTCRN